MRSQIIFSILLIASLIRCDQSPTTLDEVPFSDEQAEVVFSVEITSFEFDYQTQEFFLSVSATSPAPELFVSADLLISSVLIKTFELNDQGQGGDIQINDHAFDMGWKLPDSLGHTIDSTWTAVVQAHSNGNQLQDEATITPEIPSPPVIGTIWHRDTIRLAADSLILDTLSVEVTHPHGLDEIRDVWLLSQKPDGTWSNQGQPIHLHDDGGSIVFFNYEGIDFTSGDKVPGDGIYSLMVGFLNDQFTQVGLYQRTFYARSWFGIISEPVEDSLVLLAPETFSSTDQGPSVMAEVLR